jgi:CheY-like chemotaxis protein
MSTSLRIAIADDEPDMRDYYARILTRLGHQVVVMATTGNELLEKCQSTPHDLVISDIRMPDLDGLEAATRLCRQHPVPVILVSAYHDQRSHVADQDLIQAYLVKPIKQADLDLFHLCGEFLLPQSRQPQLFSENVDDFQIGCRSRQGQYRSLTLLAIFSRDSKIGDTHSSRWFLSPAGRNCVIDFGNFRKICLICRNSGRRSDLLWHAINSDVVPSTTNLEKEQ